MGQNQGQIMRCGERGMAIEAKHGMWQMRQGNRGKVWDVAIEARHGMWQ